MENDRHIKLPIEFKCLVLDTLDNLEKFTTNEVKLNSYFYIRVRFKKPGKANVTATYYFVKQRQLGIDYISFIGKAEINVFGDGDKMNETVGDVITLGKSKQDFRRCIDAMENNITKYAIFFASVIKSTNIQDYFHLEMSSIKPYSFTFLEPKEERQMSHSQFQAFCLEHGITPIKQKTDLRKKIDIKNANPEAVSSAIIDFLSGDEKHEYINLDIAFKNPKYGIPGEPEIHHTGFLINAIYYKVHECGDNPNGLRLIIIKFKSVDRDTHNGSDIIVCDIERHNIKDTIINAIQKLYEVIKETFDVEELKVKVTMWYKLKDEVYEEEN